MRFLRLKIRKRFYWLLLFAIILRTGYLILSVEQDDRSRSRKDPGNAWVHKARVTIVRYIRGPAPPRVRRVRQPPTHGSFTVTTYPCKTRIEANGKTVGKTKCRVKYEYNGNRTLAETLTIKAIPLEPGLWVQSKTFRAGTRPRSVRFTYPLKQRSHLPSGEKTPWSSSLVNQGARTFELVRDNPHKFSEEEIWQIICEEFPGSDPETLKETTHRRLHGHLNRTKGVRIEKDARGKYSIAE